MAVSGKSLFKYGCFGCGAVVALALVLVVAASLTALVQVNRATPEQTQLAQELPRAPAPEAGEAAVAPPPGRVMLDLHNAEIEIEPAAPGEPLRVEGRFDTKSYELVESRGEDAAGGFSYELRFRQTRMFDLSGLRRLFGGAGPKIHVYLPRDVPFALEADLGKGEAQIDLGALSLTSLDLQFRQGAVVIDVSQPLAAPAEHVNIDGRMGALLARNLGNTSARRMQIHGGMGAVVADLRGHWLNDAQIEVTVAMGGGEVRLPEDVDIRGLPDRFARYNTTPEPELPRPKLDISVHFDMGNLEVIP